MVSDFGAHVTNGSFSVIARNGRSDGGTKSAVQRLKLYIGAKDMNAKLVVQSTEAAKKVITTNVLKTDGTRNFVWTIDSTPTATRMVWTTWTEPSIFMLE